MKLNIEVFFDKLTFTLTYLVYDPKSKDCIIIDPVLNFDPTTFSFSDNSINKLTEFINKLKLKLHYILETHAHADHITGASNLKDRFPLAKIGIGKNITIIQKAFKDLLNLDYLLSTGEQFDHLFEDNEEIFAGTIKIKSITTPGHTPACLSYLIQDDLEARLFCGDALFMPDTGTGRCDFPDGSAELLFNSIHQKIYKLSNDTQVFTGHDYQSGGRELKYQTTILASKNNNIFLKQTTSKEQFVDMRNTRDQDLLAPKLLFQSIQININGGKLPPKESNGQTYLKIPIQPID